MAEQPAAALVAQAYHPKIAIDGSGNAIVLWQRHDSVRYTILASRYDAGSGTWGAAMPVMSELGSAYGPNHNIAFDNSGNAIAVWSQSDGVRYSIWANRYSATSGTWGTAALIETDNTAPFGAFAPEIAIDPDGNGIAVWFQHDGTRNNIWANRYSAASATWGAAVLIETDNAGTAKNPEIAMDHSGNAIVVWYQSDGTRYNILANRYSTSSAAWGTAQLIETNDAGAGAYAYSPQIAMDGSGNALVVWYQYDSSMHNNIWANRYSTPSGTWGTAQLIETDNAGGAYNPQIAMDGNGNALAVWAQSDGTRNNISANRFNTASGTWGVVQLIGTDIARNAYPPRIAMDNSGNAVAVWFQYDNGTSYYSNIWANRYE